MDIEMRKFDLSRAVIIRLRKISDRRAISKTQTIHQCLAMGNFIISELESGRRFFAGSEQLTFPKPTQITDPPLNALVINMRYGMMTLLNLIGEEFIIDEHSVLGWSSDCLNIIDEARSTGQVVTRGKGGVLKLPLL